ncbi:MAG TPA: thiol reductant ABC exporter subunit CydD [Gaiellaceae bacterium]|nr:thiol reductant ABC exporter subunit CydD [Gaiellaceae bacterium]
MRPLDPRLLGRARSARVLVVADVVIGIATAFLVLLQATLLARIIAASFDGASLDEVSGELVLLAGVFAARGVLAWAFEVAGRRGAVGVLSQLRLEIAEKRLRRDPAALDGPKSAEIATIAVHGIEPLEAYFGRFLPQVVLAVVVPIAVLMWVVPIDATSAVLMLLTLPLVPLFMVLIGRYTERKTRDRARALTLLATRFLDVVRGLPTLRAYNRGAAQADSIARASEDYRTTTMRTLRIAFLSGAVLELAAMLGIALVAVTVGVRLVDGGIGYEAGLTVLLLAPELYLPLRTLAAQYHASADGVAVAERLLELTGEQLTPPRAPAPPSRPAGDAVVRLEQVSYAYPARSAAVLDSVDLELRANETVALVGPSGSGKSTLAAIVLGLAEPTGGRVLRAGGVSGDLASWRRGVAWVPQRATIFTGTLADNIRLGEPDADDERVRAAARLANADGFARDLPGGYETVVGDGGRPLSAGEAQRVALARAFLRDARLVVLDEPTANLDPGNAYAVAEAMERLSDRRAVLVIAHRPELVLRADRVVRLEAGRITDAQMMARTS